jgi:hypothetical protein
VAAVDEGVPVSSPTRRGDARIVYHATAARDGRGLEEWFARAEHDRRANEGFVFFVRIIRSPRP